MFIRVTVNSTEEPAGPAIFSAASSYCHQKTIGREHVNTAYIQDHPDVDRQEERHTYSQVIEKSYHLHASQKHVFNYFVADYADDVTYLQFRLTCAGVRMKLGDLHPTYRLLEVKPCSKTIAHQHLQLATVLHAIGSFGSKVACNEVRKGDRDEPSTEASFDLEPVRRQCAS